MCVVLFVLYLPSQICLCCIFLCFNFYYIYFMLYFSWCIISCCIVQIKCVLYKMNRFHIVLYCNQIVFHQLFTLGCFKDILDLFKLLGSLVLYLFCCIVCVEVFILYLSCCMKLSLLNSYFSTLLIYGPPFITLNFAFPLF